MAVRQYIGARYVPTYYKNSLDPTSSEWEPNVQYNPLTIVSLPNLHSYQSKKFVPANIGSPASNPEYWYDQGYANAYYQALQDQIDEMKDGDVPGSLQEQINENTSDIEELTKKTTSCAIYLGNSYCVGVGSTSGTDGIFSKSKKMFDEAYEFYEGGIGFLPYSGRTVTFEDKLDEAIASTSFDNADVTDIIILSACGDTSALQYYGEATFITQMQSALASLKSKISANFSDKVRVSVTLCDIRSHRTLTWTVGTSDYYRPFHIHKVFSKLLAEAGIEYLGWIGFNAMMDTNYTSSDYYHPSDVGYNVLGSLFRSAYQGTFSYKSLIKDVTFKGTVSGTPNEVDIPVTIIQTPELSRLIFGVFETPAIGTSPAQYTNVDWIIMSDTNDTHISPVLNPGADIQMGAQNILLPREATAFITILAYIQGGSDGYGTLKGMTYTEPVTYGARVNNCYSFRELTIPF